MAFAFNPDDGPARLIRFVKRGTIPGVGLYALLDAAANLLIIDDEWFQTLTEAERHIVLRTHRSYIDNHTRIAA